MTTTQNGPLPDQFACQPDHLQASLFRLIDVICGMSQDEKAQAREFISTAIATDMARDNLPATELLQAINVLMFVAERLAEQPAR